MLGRYWNLETPAKSAPAYEHQLQQNTSISGLKSGYFTLAFAFGMISHLPFS